MDGHLKGMGLKILEFGIWNLEFGIYLSVGFVGGGDDNAFYFAVKPG